MNCYENKLVAICSIPTKISKIVWNWRLYKLYQHAVGDFANSKCYQRLNKILIFYPHYIWEIIKVVYGKSLSCNTPAKLDAVLGNQHVLVINANVSYAWWSFLVNNFSGVPDVQVKNQDFVQSSMAFQYSNICYWNHWFKVLL